MATAGLFSMLGGGDEAAMQRQLDEQRALEYAKLTADQRGAQAAYRAGSRLGEGIAGAFGMDVRDPEVKAAAMKQRIASNIDYSNLDSVQKGIKSLAEAGFSKDAQDLAKALEASELNKANITAKTAEKLTPEQKNAAALADASGATRGTSEWAQAYKTSLTELTAKAEGKINYGAETERISKEQFNKPFADLTQEQAAKVGAIVVQHDIASKKAGAGKPVDVASIIKEIGTKEDVKDKAATWKAAGDAYKMQVPMIAKLQEVKEALPKTFTGSFSDTALQFGKGLSALGVPVDRNKLANTEYMNSVSAQVLQTIARNFPGSLAVKEMDQLVKSKFSSQQQIETITRVLGDLQTEIEAGTKSYEQLAKLPESDRYTKDLNYLTGQNFNKLKRYRALEQKANSLSGGQKMTASEVEEAKKLQADLGV